MKSAVVLSQYKKEVHDNFENTKIFQHISDISVEAYIV
jgi:hypothetical protein